jgi:hypothetical protein
VGCAIWFEVCFSQHGPLQSECQLTASIVAVVGVDAHSDNTVNAQLLLFAPAAKKGLLRTPAKSRELLQLHQLLGFSPLMRI